MKIEELAEKGFNAYCDSAGSWESAALAIQSATLAPILAALGMEEGAGLEEVEERVKQVRAQVTANVKAHQSACRDAEKAEAANSSLSEQVKVMREVLARAGWALKSAINGLPVRNADEVFVAIDKALEDVK